MNVSRAKEYDMGWTFEKVALRLRFTLARPEGVSEVRWSAMIRQVWNVYGFNGYTGEGY